MDMIYASSEFVDQGVLQDYSFDMEYGVGEKDTNTFSCKIQKYNDVMQGANPITQDFVLYIENTEYGGIIDRVESDTKTGEITLTGRTWHGVLNSFVIEPPAGLAYRSYYGTCTQVLTQMIADAGLTQFFVVDDIGADDQITVANFEVRYEAVYDAIIRMLNYYNGKFKCYYKNNKVHIFGVLSCNYAVNEEFDSSQVPFKVGITYNNINHMICLGQGNGEKRAVIHLFTDDGGTLQPYKKVDNPIQDSDYYLDKSQQVMTGIEERCYIYDYPNAEITYNYPLLTSKPAAWEQDYYKIYYEQVEDSSGTQKFELIERVFMDRLYLLTVEPIDWHVNSGYKRYYTVNSDASQSTPVTDLQEDDPDCRILFLPTGGKVGKFWDWDINWRDYYEYDSANHTYVSAPTDHQIYYIEVTSKPQDWDWHYSNYYTRYWNGYTWVYNTISGVPDPKYHIQISQPTNWETDWGSYYTVATKQKKEKGQIKYKKGDWITVQTAVDTKLIKTKKGKTFPEWKSNKFYTLEMKYVPPAFPDTVWYQMQRDIAPAWEDYRYYKREVDRTPPFRLPDPANGFYGYWELHKNEEQIPDFVPNTYHYQTEDRFKVMVDDAIQKLAELCDTSSLSIDLELEENYDVGDIVGSIDTVTGIEVNKPILRKVIKIKKGILTITHEVE